MRWFWQLVYSDAAWRVLDVLAKVVALAIAVGTLGWAPFPVWLRVVLVPVLLAAWLILTAVVDAWRTRNVIAAPSRPRARSDPARVRQGIEEMRKALGVGREIPKGYETFLLECPLAEDEVEYWLDPKDVLKANLDARRDGFFGEPWPAHYLAIGDDDAGNILFLDLSEPQAPVRMADHEGKRAGRIAVEDRLPSADALLAAAQREFEERREERARAIAARQRRLGK